MYKAATYLAIAFFTSTTAIAQEKIKKFADTVTPFTAYYSIIHNDNPVGKGKRQLVKQDDGSYLYSYSTDISWLIFSDNRKEVSTVTINDQHVIPVDYVFKREGTGSDKHYHWQYSPNNNLATNVRKEKSLSVDFPDNFQDKLSYHLQHRINMSNNPTQSHYVYPVITSSGKIKNYVYQYDGEEELMLPYGLVKTIRLKREVVEKKRLTYAWFAPELGYLLVKLRQIKDDVQQFEAQLTDLDINTEDNQ